MTVQEALNRTDGLKPNQYGEEQKLGWLSHVEGMAVNEIINPHAEKPEPFTAYTTADKERTLRAPEPYSDLYIKYLCACIDFYNAEIGRYNNSMMMFNLAWQAYADYVNRAAPAARAGRIVIE